jgi:xylulose-5-phosphate/fructose-6-phosphate phosphoketolase
MSDRELDTLFTTDKPVIFATPFDMVMLNDLDRFHLVIDVIDRVDRLGTGAANLRQRMVDARPEARRYTREFGEDQPEIANWTWNSG